MTRITIAPDQEDIDALLALVKTKAPQAAPVLQVRLRDGGTFEVDLVTPIKTVTLEVTLTPESG